MSARSEDLQSEALSFADPAMAIAFLLDAVAAGRLALPEAHAVAGASPLVTSATTQSTSDLRALVGAALASSDAGAAAVLVSAHADALCAGGKPTEGLLLYDALATGHAKEGRPHQAAVCRVRRGVALYRLGRYEEAVEELAVAERGLEPDCRERAPCQANRGHALATLGRRREAAESYRAAAQGYASLGELAREASCRRRRGKELHGLGEYEAAADESAAAAAAFAAAERPLDAAACQRERAISLEGLERFSEALTACDEAAAAYARHGSALEVARCQEDRGLLLKHLGRHEEALASLDEAIAVYEAQGPPVRRAATRLSRSEVLLALGRVEQALEDVEAALAVGEVSLRTEAGMQRSQILQHLGRLPEALAELQRAEADCLARGLEGDAAQCRMSRGLVLQDLGRFEEALAACEAAEEVLAASGHRGHRARCRSTRAVLLHQLGRYAEARVAAEGAEAAFLELGRAMEAATWRVLSVATLLALGLPEQALEGCQSAYEIARQHGNTSIMASAALQATGVLTVLGRHEEAVEAAEEARELFAALGQMTQVASCLLARAGALDELGRHEEALRDYEEGERAALAIGRTAIHASCQMDRAATLVNCGRPAEAVAVYERIDRQILSDDGLLRYHTGFGNALLDTGQPERGLGQLAEGRRALRRARRTGGIDETSLEFVEQRQTLLRAEVQHAVTLGQPERAFEAVQDGKASVLGDLRWRLPRQPLPEPEEVLARRARLTEWLRRSPEHTRDDAPYWHEVSGRAQAYLRAWRQALRDSAPLSSDGAEAVSLGEVQTALPADWALLDFYRVGEEAFLAFVVRRDGLCVQELRLPLSDPDFQARLSALEQSIATTSPGADDVLDDLDAHLFAPLRPRLGDVAGLYLVPHGVLHSLPLHAARRRQGGQVCYLCDELTVAYLPSAALLPRLPPLVSGGAILSLANPERGTPRSLPFAEWESAEIQRRLAGVAPGQYFRGSEATTARTKDWGAAALVHLSCHGLADERLGALSRLMLADDLLLAHDVVYRRPALAEGALVVLSGCETGARDWRAVDEAMGLMSAFLMRGAGLVLATQWSVEDASAAELVVTFVSELLVGGAAPAEALRRAQRRARTLTAAQVQAREDELLRQLRQTDPAGADKVRRRGALRDLCKVADEGPTPYDHPVYWAAFQLVGRVT
jgi:CHAT domain-containing protein/tetratricopeptide (TPR) repeat protein